MNSIRSVRAEEVSCRIQKCYDGKASFLLYIDSRACRKILDETFGITGWRNWFEEIKGVLYCTIEIWDEEKSQWIAKSDCGTASRAEKEKGEASDAFKRAAFSLGVARELYTKIPIWINLKTKEITDRNGKKAFVPSNPYAAYTVARLEVNRKTGKINYICITDKDYNAVFQWGASASGTPYIDNEAEQAYSALRIYCEQYAEIKENCNVEAVIKAAMRGKELSSSGYSQAIIEIRKQYEILKKEQDAKQGADENDPINGTA